MSTTGPGSSPASHRKGLTVLITILVVLAVALIVYSSMRQGRVSCEVCVAFQGRSQCRSATAPTRDEAVRTATNNACGILTSGMANTIQCGNMPPQSVTCEP